MVSKREDLAAHLEFPLRVVSVLRGSLGERLVAVVLFGSQARGDASVDSDWDLLVIAKDLPSNYWKRHLYFVGALPVDLRGGSAILARTPEEFEARIPSLHLDIALDGKVLYDPHHYAESKLGYIRNLITQAGLVRERTEAGDLWLWDKQPVGPWALEWGN
jgi:uncharacterized protein